MRSRLSFALILASVVIAPASVGAQPKPDAPKPEAGKTDAVADPPKPKTDAQKAEEARLVKLAATRLADLVKRGNEACERGELDDGVAALTAAWTQKADADVAAALASCEMKAGHWGGAADHLTAALRQKEEGPDRKKLEEQLAEAHKRTGRLAIVVAQEGADIFVGNRFVGQSPLPGEVHADAGKPVTVVIKKTGFDEVQRRVELTARGVAQVKVDLAPASEVNRYASANRPRAPFYVMGVAALVAGGVGGALYAAGATKGSAADDLLASLPGTTPCKAASSGVCPQILSLRQGHDKLWNMGTGFMIGGGALLAAAALYGAWAFSGSSVSTGSAGRPRVAVTPSFSREGAGLLVGGSF